MFINIFRKTEEFSERLFFDSGGLKFSIPNTATLKGFVILEIHIKLFNNNANFNLFMLM